MDLLQRLVGDAEGEWALTGIGFLFVLALMFGIRLIGARVGQRVPLRLVGTFLFLHVCLFSMRQLAPNAWTTVRAVFGTAAVLFLGLAIGRAAFLLVFDVLLVPKREARQAAPLPRIVRDIVQGAIYLVVVLAALHAAGVAPGQLLTTSALLTVVAGLALQETLGNLVAGLAIQIERPFDVGDWVEVHGQPGHYGRVREINWRATRLHTLENTDVIVPNAFIAKMPVTNFDRPHRAARRNIHFSTPFSAEPEAVKARVLAAIRDADGVLESPEPSVITVKFDEHGITYSARFFVDDNQRRDVIEGNVRDRVWYALSRAKIELTYPSRTLHMHEVTEESRRLAEDAARDRKRDDLRHVDLLAELPESAVAIVAEHARSLRFAAGETVIRQGATGDEMYVVLSGELSVRVSENGNGQPTELARIGPGDFFGEMSVLTGAPRGATVAAITSCQLYEIKHDGFLQLLKVHPHLADVISRVVSERRSSMVLSRPSEAAPSTAPEAHDLLHKIRSFFKLSR